jgi:hypothetical protein
VKSPDIDWCVVVIFVVSSGFSFVDGSLVADPPTIFLAGLIAAGMLVCEYSMRGRRRRRSRRVLGHRRPPVAKLRECVREGFSLSPPNATAMNDLMHPLEIASVDGLTFVAKLIEFILVKPKVKESNRGLKQFANRKPPLQHYFL